MSSYLWDRTLAFIVSSIEEYNIMDTEEMIRKKHKDHNKEEIIKNNDVDQSVELKGVKKGLFENMQRSKEYIQATTFMEVDMQRIIELHIQKKYSYTSFIAHAVIKALIKYPMINSIFFEGQLINKKHITLGISLDNQGNLFVPVLKNAESMDIDKIANLIRTYMEKANMNKLTVDDLSDGTFTITNSGIFSSSFFTPVINFPQIAILGIGKVTDRAVVHDNEVIIKPIMILSLSYDHRIIVGSIAVKFLSEVRVNLENMSFN